MKKTIEIPINKIAPDPKQPRQEFEVGAMQRLEESIKKQGVLVPIAVEEGGGKFLLIDGERRYRASKALGLRSIPAIVHEKMSELERLVTRFHMQEQHSSWSAFDKAQVIASLVNDLGGKKDEIAGLLGMSQKTVRDYLSCLRFPTEQRA